MTMDTMTAIDCDLTREDAEKIEEVLYGPQREWQKVKKVRRLRAKGVERRVIAEECGVSIGFVDRHSTSPYLLGLKMAPPKRERGKLSLKEIGRLVYLPPTMKTATGEVCDGGFHLLDYNGTTDTLTALSLWTRREYTIKWKDIRRLYGFAA